jgi:hypothetical protein
VIIKPHPRDARAKIDALALRLRELGHDVVVLSSPWTFYGPFESILTRLLASVPNLPAKTTIACVSSSCLGLELLFGVRCELGFGERLVRQHFFPYWQQGRLDHERDLLRAMDSIRTRQPLRHAA